MEGEGESSFPQLEKESVLWKKPAGVTQGDITSFHGHLSPHTRKGREKKKKKKRDERRK